LIDNAITSNTRVNAYTQFIAVCNFSLHQWGNILIGIISLVYTYASSHMP